MAVTFLQGNFPTPVVGAVGTTVSLPSLLNAAFGENAQLISGAWLAYYGAPAQQAWNSSYWNTSSPSVSAWRQNGTAITAATTTNFNQKFVSAAEFAGIDVQIGNCIMPNLYLTVRIDQSLSDPVYVQYALSSVSMAPTAMAQPGHAPTPDQVVATAISMASQFPDTPNSNDCHSIATIVAAAAGAPLTSSSGSLNPNENIEHGFWRIAYRGVPDTQWESLTRPGDIVRFDWASPSEPQHTTLIMGDVQPDGRVEVYDNGDFRGGISYIGRHAANYDERSVPATVTIYRLTTDDLYLIRTSAAAEIVLGTTFNDQIFAGGGSDIVHSAIGSDVVDGGAGSDSLNGGSGNDILNGDSGNDTLNGGTGVDQMSGGSGNDLYTVDSSTDVTTESASAGTDTVQSRVTHTLRANVENLVLTENATRGTGNTLANTLTGNTRANTLSGDAGNDSLDGGSGNDTVNGGSGNDTLNGGLGTDQMLGGAGNDLYVVNNSTDVVTENANEGRDHVQSGGANHTLGANVEHLTLTGTGRDGIGNNLSNVITGNSIANQLTGGSGNDTLGGGLGNDILAGGTGSDRFFFDTALNGSTNVDVISDFNPVADALRLDDVVFTGLALGTLSSSAFRSGTAAQDSSDRIIYNSTTGAVLYDADGTGVLAAVRFTTLAAGLAITNSDFIVV